MSLKRVTCRSVAALGGLLGTVLLGQAADVDAWPSVAYRDMVYDALRIMPPSLGRVLWRNDEHLLRGVYRLEGEMASSLVRDGLHGALSEATTGDVERRVARVAAMVGEHRPFREVAFELGKLLRIAADIADPSIVGAGDPRLARAAGELQSFVNDHLAEIPLVYDETLPSTLGGAPTRLLLERLHVATGESVERLADAFWKEGRVVRASEFDYRSVPFAEVSLGYSRGVTAASLLWLAAWARANGDFTGYRFHGKEPGQHPFRANSNKERP